MVVVTAVLLSVWAGFAAAGGTAADFQQVGARVLEKGYAGMTNEQIAEFLILYASNNELFDQQECDIILGNYAADATADGASPEQVKSNLADIIGQVAQGAGEAVKQQLAFLPGVGDEGSLDDQIAQLEQDIEMQNNAGSLRDPKEIERLEAELAALLEKHDAESEADSDTDTDTLTVTDTVSGPDIPEADSSGDDSESEGNLDEQIQELEEQIEDEKKLLEKGTGDEEVLYILQSALDDLLHKRDDEQEGDAEPDPDTDTDTTDDTSSDPDMHEDDTSPEGWDPEAESGADEPAHEDARIEVERDAREYAHSKGLDDDAVEQYAIGMSTYFVKAFEAAREKGASIEEAEKMALERIMMRHGHLPRGQGPPTVLWDLMWSGPQVIAPVETPSADVPDDSPSKDPPDDDDKEKWWEEARKDHFMEIDLFGSDDRTWDMSESDKARADVWDRAFDNARDNGATFFEAVRAAGKALRDYDRNMPDDPPSGSETEVEVFPLFRQDAPGKLITIAPDRVDNYTTGIYSDFINDLHNVLPPLGGTPVVTPGVGGSDVTQPVLAMGANPNQNTFGQLGGLIGPPNFQAGPGGTTTLNITGNGTFQQLLGGTFFRMVVGDWNVNPNSFTFGAQNPAADGTREVTAWGPGGIVPDGYYPLDLTGDIINNPSIGTHTMDGEGTINGINVTNILVDVPTN